MKPKLAIAVVAAILLSVISGFLISFLFYIAQEMSIHLILPGYPWWMYQVGIVGTGLVPALLALVIVWIVLRRVVFKPFAGLAETIKRQEREAFFGKLAAGLIHDLRHPIQNLQNCGRNLDRATLDPELRTTLQKNFAREFEKINHFLKDLEGLSCGIPHLPTCVNLALVVEETVASFEEDARGKQVKIDMACDPIEVKGDRFALIRLFSNLIANALQAMPDGGLLRIDTCVAVPMIAISVEDSGCGIPKERLDKIFDEFWTSKERGLGLGLAIAKKIVAQHDGKIDVKSEPGKGSCFTVYFPLIAAPQ